MFRYGNIHHRRDAATLASLLCVLALASVEVKAQSRDAADGVIFDERFSIASRVVPTFTRPEVSDLFSGLRPWASTDETVASLAAANELHSAGSLGPITLAEPKGPARVLKDLLNTPVEELLVSKAEAGPEVPLPSESQNAPPLLPQPTGAPAQSVFVPARAPDPVAERPPAENDIPGSTSSSAQAELPPDLPQEDFEAGSSQNTQSVAVAPTIPAPTSSGPVAPPESVAGSDQMAAAPGPSSSEPTGTATSGEPGPELPAAQAVQPQATGALKERRRVERGRAAWYQHPGRTASGEKFDPNQLTAAHHTLSFGTQVRVVNEKTGRSVVVRINDRIPRKAKIVIDLSRASAEVIGLASVGRVSLHDLGRASSGSGTINASRK